MELLRSEHWVVTREDRLHLVRLVRTKAPFRDLPALEQSIAELVSVWAHVDRRKLRLLLDVREGPMRNDDAFEHTMAKHRAALFGGFASVAVLVKTAVGKLQLRRLVKEEAATYSLFDDEAAALAHLASAPLRG